MAGHPRGNDQDIWFDDEGGPLVRPYTLTGGRTRPAGADIDLLTQVVAKQNPDRGRLSVEDRDILERCAPHPLSVAEIAADLDLPLAVAKVLVGDLLARDLLVAGEPPAPGRPDRQVLEAVLDGVRKL
jgi:hypothetical protein